MDHQKLEFFKLDETDRKVLFWLMDHHNKSLQSWIEYIVNDYKRTKNVHIDGTELFNETQEKKGK